MEVVNFNTNSKELERRGAIHSIDEIKKFDPLQPTFQLCVQLMNDESAIETGCLVCVLQAGDDTAIIVATENMYQQKAQFLHNVKAKARQRQSLKFIVEKTAPLTVIRDYLIAEKRKEEGIINQSTAIDNEKKSIALQELNELVRSALMIGASDIHIEVGATQAKIYFRANGELTDRQFRERHAVAPMIAAALNARSDDFDSIFNEEEKNQNTVNVDEVQYEDPITKQKVTKSVRLRVQKTPSYGGFRVTARIQFMGVEKQLSLRDLNLEDDVRKILETAFEQPNGVILFSGPVGQGKTTTLVACNEIPIRKNKKVISLEDPIEIIQPDILQTQCKVGDPVFSYPKMIESSLRDDMDVLEVSEIRDLETASAALRGALTGRLMVSTIHAVDPIGIVKRLINLGMNASDLADVSGLRFLTGQRLIPKLCNHCKIEHEASKLPEGLEFTGEHYYTTNPNGCEHCDNTGSKGRILIMEALVVDKQGREFIESQDFESWRIFLRKNGYLTMADRAWKRVAAGELDPHKTGEMVPNMWVTKNNTSAFDYRSILTKGVVL